MGGNPSFLTLLRPTALIMPEIEVKNLDGGLQMREKFWTVGGDRGTVF